MDDPLIEGIIDLSSILLAVRFREKTRKRNATLEIISSNCDSQL